MATAPGVERGFAGDVDTLVNEALAEAGAPQEATVSWWLGGLDGVGTGGAADVQHYAASTMKLPLVMAAYRRHERGELDLDREVPVHNLFASALDGSPFSLDRSEDEDDETWDRVGSTGTLRWLAERAIVKSGNLATNLLLEHVGAGAVAEVLADAGCSDEIILPRGIEDAAAREAGLDNLVTAADLAHVMLGVAARTLAEERTCEQVEEILARQQYRDQIPAGVPAGTYVANKTGWVTGVAHDVALVRPADRPPYVLVVCTSIDLPEERAARLIAAISRCAWEEWHR
jgi:beta-lactamase class A